MSDCKHEWEKYRLDYLRCRLCGERKSSIVIDDRYKTNDDHYKDSKMYGDVR